MNNQTQLLLKETESIKNELIAFRRHLHKNPEVGTNVPNSINFIKNELTKIGYNPKVIANAGVLVEIGKRINDKVYLIHADFDGLKIQEETNLEFKSTNGNMHACGHDMNAAMLFGAAKLLMKYKDKINGLVKILFQSGEENFIGAKTMIENKVLENPKVSAGMTCHLFSRGKSGIIVYNRNQTPMSGCVFFRIDVKGISCHGALPEYGVDPINIAAHIHLALQTITSREIKSSEAVTLTIGKFIAGNSSNAIPDSALMEGSIRAHKEEILDKIIKRIGEISTNIAKSFNGDATLTITSRCKVLKNNNELFDNHTLKNIKELFGDKVLYQTNEFSTGADDFAEYSDLIPINYIMIGGGSKEENPAYGNPMHNSKLILNEDVLTEGAALFVYNAIEFTK